MHETDSGLRSDVVEVNLLGLDEGTCQAGG